MGRKEANEKFLKALRQFEDAADHLNEVWNQIDHTGDYYADKYPFGKSFDDVCRSIYEWRAAQEDSAQEQTEHP